MLTFDISVILSLYLLYNTYEYIDFLRVTLRLQCA